MDAKEEKIRVAVRVRPINDPTSEEAISLSPDRQHVQVYADSRHSSAANFRCGTYLPPDITQDAVFDEIRGPELVEAALDGFPVTIFAYGQTGAGKSYTIFGREDSAAPSSRKCIDSKVSDTDGILPRAAVHLMTTVDQRCDLIEYTLRVTCVEIYNEQVRDLFDSKKESLPVRHSKEHGFYLENATVVQCKTAKEIIRVVKLAATNRIKSAHLLNERSNRSHCLVTIYIDSMPRDETYGAKKYGKLTIVDLAGSERANDTGAVGQQLKETGHINKSLYCLSKVIHAMTANTKAPACAKTKFVPYRDSKLTMLLIDSLGGKSRTLMVACVNAAQQFAVESTRTLEFAMGVAKIKNRPTAVLNPHEKMIFDLKEEIRLLKLENMLLRSRTPGYFVDHPEAEDRLNSSSADIEPKSASPLCRALLSGRHHPEDLQFMTRERLQAHKDNNGQGESLPSREITRRMSLYRSTATSGVRGIKKIASMRRHGVGENKKKKSFRSHTGKPLPQRRSQLPGRLDPEEIALPPVRPAVTLFQKRERNQVAQTQRPSSPPPDYDELFGIETVPVMADNPTAPILLPRRSLSSLPTIEHPDPVDHIQNLLRNMLPPQRTPERKFPSGTSNTARHQGAPQFDDARAQDLFHQLCQL